MIHFNFKPHELTCISFATYTGLAWQFNYQKSNYLAQTDGQVCRLGGKKNTPQQIVGTSNLFTPNLSKYD